MKSDLLLPDGTTIHLPVTPVPTKEVEEEEEEQAKPPSKTSDKGFHLLEKARTGAGSTAAAGSDFFHIYRKMRAKEMARIDQMDEESRQAEFERVFHEKREQRIREALAKTAKKAAKRQQAKLRRRAALSNSR